MKLGLPAKLAILLLMASSFSYATSCQDYLGDTVYLPGNSTASGTVCPSSVCMQMSGSAAISCYVNPDDVCIVDGDGVAFPMRVSSVPCQAEDPDDSNNPIYTELNQMAWLGRSADCSATDDTCLRLSNQALFNFQDLGKELVKLSQNDNVINTNVVTLAQKISSLSTYVNAAKVSSDLAKSSADAAKNSSDLTRDVVTQKTTDILTEVSESNASLTEIKTLVQDAEQTSAQDALDNKQLHQQTHSAQATAQTTLDTISQDAENAAHNSALAFDNASQANYNAQQAIIAATDAGGIGAMAYQAANGALENTNAIYSMLYEFTEGETAEPGEGTDMTETNEILNSIRSDANTNTDRVIDSISPLESQLSDVNGNLGWLSEHVGQQLQGIQTAIENGSGTGGGSDDDTVTNQKLDGLGDKLDGIKSSIDGLTDTTGLSQQLSDLNNNTNADLSADMDSFYSEFNTEEKMDQLQTTVSGMVSDSGLSDYDTVDKVRGSLAEATTISQVFDVSRATCSPYQFWQKEIDFCPAARNTSMVLEYFIWAITAIFAFLHITAFLTKLRTE